MCIRDSRHADQLHRLHADVALLLVFVGVVGVDAFVDEGLGHFDLGVHVDELVLPELALDQRLAEHHTLFAVLTRKLDGEARAGDARDRACLLYTSPSPPDRPSHRMHPSLSKNT